MRSANSEDFRVRVVAVNRGEERGTKVPDYPGTPLQLKPLRLRTHTDMVAELVCVVLHCDT